MHCTWKCKKFVIFKKNRPPNVIFTNGFFLKLINLFQFLFETFDYIFNGLSNVFKQLKKKEEIQIC